MGTDDADGACSFQADMFNLHTGNELMLGKKGTSYTCTIPATWMVQVFSVPSNWGPRYALFFNKVASPEMVKWQSTLDT